MSGGKATLRAIAAIAFTLILGHPCFAGQLRLDFVDSGRPSRVVVQVDHATPTELTGPTWAMDLPKIPEGKWQVHIHLTISSDTMHATAHPMDMAIPIRFSRFQAQNPENLIVPIFIMTEAPVIANQFATKFERPLKEIEVVPAFFQSSYAFTRLEDRTGPFARRVLHAYLQRAFDYNTKYRYITAHEDAIKLVKAMLDSPASDIQQATRDRFRDVIQPTRAARGVALLEQFTFEAWDDLNLINPASTADTLRDEHDKCPLASYYLAEFDSKPVDVQQVITKRLGFTDAVWASIRAIPKSPLCNKGTNR